MRIPSVSAAAHTVSAKKKKKLYGYTLPGCVWKPASWMCYELGFRNMGKARAAEALKETEAEH